MPLGLDGAPLITGDGELSLVAPIEEHHASGISGKLAGIGAVNEEQGVGAVRVLEPRGQEDRLAGGAGLAIWRVRQEALVAIGPKPPIQMLDPLVLARPHDGLPATRQGSLQKLGQDIIQVRALKMVEPDLARRLAHTAFNPSNRVSANMAAVTSSGWVVMAR